MYLDLNTSYKAGMTTLENSTDNVRTSKTYELTIDAVFIALVLAATWLINIRLPLAGSGGLIHLGNVPLLVAAMMYGRKTGAIAGAFGMGLFDIMSGWAAWSPFTFVIVGTMGYVVGWFAEARPIKNAHINNIVSVICAIIIKVIGYYLAEGILYGNWIAPAGSIPGNIIQVGVAGMIVIPMIQQLRRFRR